MTFVSPEEFKTHFEDCVRQVRDAIGSRKYGLLLGDTTYLRVIGDTINHTTRNMVKSTQAFAHVVESVMGRPASVYVSDEVQHHNFRNSGIGDWIWFDDGVYSGDQFYNGFHAVYNNLPGRIHIVAPYATDRLLRMIDTLRHERRTHAEFATVCTKVSMPKLSNTFQKLFYRYPRRASSNATPPPPLDDSYNLNPHASTYVMPHKVPDGMSFAYARALGVPPTPYYKFH